MGHENEFLAKGRQAHLEGRWDPSIRLDLSHRHVTRSWDIYKRHMRYVGCYWVGLSCSLTSIDYMYITKLWVALKDLQWSINKNRLRSIHAKKKTKRNQNQISLDLVIIIRILKCTFVDELKSKCIRLSIECGVANKIWRHIRVFFKQCVSMVSIFWSSANHTPSKICRCLIKKNDQITSTYQTKEKNPSNFH